MSRSMEAFALSAAAAVFAAHLALTPAQSRPWALFASTLTETPTVGAKTDSAPEGEQFRLFKKNIQAPYVQPAPFPAGVCIQTFEGETLRPLQPVNEEAAMPRSALEKDSHATISAVWWAIEAIWSGLQGIAQAAAGIAPLR